MRYRLLTLLLLVPALLVAQRMTIQPPRSVEIGVPVQLRYTVDADVDASTFHLQLPAGIQQLSRPTKSSFSSTTIINGRRTDERGTNISIVIQAQHVGKFSFPAATVKSEGRTLTSNAFQLTVTDLRPPSAATPSPDMQRAGSRVTEGDCFVELVPERTVVFENQPILMHVRLYVAAGVTASSPYFPDGVPEVANAAMQSVNTGPAQMETVTRGGRSYKVGTIGSFLFIPSAAGSFTIPAIPVRFTVVQQHAPQDILDAIFNDASMRTSVQVNRQTKPLSLHVNALPEPRPADFSGGVGQMKLSAALLTQEIRANDVATLRLSLRGVGNLNQLSAPAVSFPRDFETYPPKTADSTRLSREGSVGTVNFDYAFVPRNAGRYEIPALTLTYFNTQTRKYETLRTEPISLDVKPDDRPAADVEAERLLRESDIAPIERGDAGDFSLASPFWWGTWSYWLLLLLLLAAYFLLRPLLSRHLEARADHDGQRRRRAGRTVSRRLRQAERLLADTNSPPAAFYDEMAHALEEYLGDKFGLDRSERTRERIREILSDTRLPAEAARHFEEALAQCDMARFAPSTTHDRRALYDLAATAIGGLESVRLEKKTMKPSLSLLLLLLTFAASPLANATPRADSLKHVGDSLYDCQRYVEAVAAYDSALVDGPSAALYRNLGNAHYRMNDIARAVLYYERALRLRPADKSLRHDLALCATKLPDRFQPRHEMFFVTWTRNLRNLFSADAWGGVGICLFLLALLGLGLYQLSERPALRKTGFFGALAAALCFLVAQACAFSLRHDYSHLHRAVLTAPSVPLREASAPQSRQLRELHGGVAVTLTDSTRTAFEVELPDGERGWVGREHVEKV